MENIFYLDAKKAIENFFKVEFDTCPPKLMNRFLGFFNNLVNYEEEGVRLQPQIMFTNNIDSVARYLPDSYKIVLFNDENEAYFDNRMKSLMPFTKEDWWIFISSKENEISYGIIKTTRSIKDPNFKDSIFSNSKLKEKIDKLDIILIEQYSNFIINFSSLSGNELNINYFINQDQNAKSASDEIQKLTEATFSKLKTTSKKLTEIKTLFTQFMKTATKKVHGAICVIVDKDYVDNGFFSDGVWLKEPISFSKVFLSSKSYSEPRIEAVAGLFITMLNYDGITIIDNTGKIKAYNVFVETNMEKTRNIIGGARKRAAHTIINSRRTKIAGVYFQSHEGEIFYSDVKGYKINKAKKEKLQENSSSTSAENVASNEEKKNIVQENQQENQNNVESKTDKNEILQENNSFTNAENAELNQENQNDVEKESNENEILQENNSSINSIDTTKEDLIITNQENITANEEKIKENENNLDNSVDKNKINKIDNPLNNIVIDKETQNSNLAIKEKEVKEQNIDLTDDTSKNNSSDKK